MTHFFASLFLLRKSEKNAKNMLTKWRENVKICIAIVKWRKYAKRLRERRVLEQ